MGNNKMFVVEAIIKNDMNEILLLKRSQNNKHYVGKWQLPGGKVNFKEKLFSAIKRELIEETQLKCNNLKLSKLFFLKKDFCSYSKKNIILSVFETNSLGSVIISNEHTKYKFFNINDIDKNSLTKISQKSIFG